MITGVLLAAGAGSRFGQPKILAAHGDWLRTAVQALSAGGCGRVVVVAGAARPAVPAPAEELFNPHWQQGLGSSVAAALSHLSGEPGDPADLAVLHLVDTPDVGPDVVQRVIGAATETGLARASFGARAGHPAVLARPYWAEAIRLCRGEYGPRALFASSSAVLVPCDDLATGADVDYRRPPWDGT